MRRKIAIFIGLGLALVLAVAAWMVLGQKAGDAAVQSDSVILDEGIALFRENRHEEAFEKLRGIPKNSPLEWRARYYQGSSLIMLKNYRDAVLYLEQALALNDRETPILHALGVAHYKQGNLGMAKAYFGQVLEIDPDDMEARGLMDIMAKLERYQDNPSAGSGFGDN